eukprot:SAG22_NODE_166_length_16765_cov_30.782791_4_plen_207_part_00
MRVAHELCSTANALGGIEFEERLSTDKLQCCTRQCLCTLLLEDSRAWQIYKECNDARKKCGSREAELAAANPGVGGVIYEGTNIKKGLDMHGGMPALLAKPEAAAEPTPTAAQKDPARARLKTRRADFDKVVVPHFKDLLRADDLHPDGKPLCMTAIHRLTCITKKSESIAQILAEEGRRKTHGARDGLAPTILEADNEHMLGKPP